MIIVMPQLQMPEQPAPPPTPIRPETREYNWPESATSPAASTFSIVSNDRREQPAVAVWAQDHSLCYIAPNGTSGRTPIESIDREATIQRNAEKNLRLWLPPGR
jgi:hypothetical protein